ncbi:MAG: cobalamin B12-binding domain-containing protein [Candidatus Brocadiae bacterium]|nr:cobalamin B12-binding domain-containing protein [Candidatus Brocadiia bacterium]
MKILFISANQEKNPDLVYPIGLAYIVSASIQDGHECSVFDANFHNDFKEPLKNILQNFHPNAIGISMRNVDNAAYPSVVSYFSHYQNLISFCREIAPETIIILGGSAFSLFSREFMEKLKPDFGIVGEGENAFLHLLQEIEKGKIQRKASQTIEERIYSSEQFAYPGKFSFELDNIVSAREILDTAIYSQNGGSINIQTKRGCCFQCSYCNYPILEGSNVRKREPADVVDEMEYCIKKSGGKYFFFVDNVFNSAEDHAMEICKEIIRRQIKIQWTAYISPFSTSEALFSLFKESGCSSIDLGVDSACELGLSVLKKPFSIQEIMDCARWCHQYKIKFNCSLIFGYPGETIQTIEECIQNISLCQPSSVIAFIGIRLHKGVPLTISLEKSGYISEDKIGIEPIFYIEESVREYLIQRLSTLPDQYKNWIMPGLNTQKISNAYVKRIRSKGFTGPLWELFSIKD